MHLGLLVHVLDGKNSKRIWARSWASCHLLLNLDNWVLGTYQATCIREEEANGNNASVRHHLGSSGCLSGSPWCHLPLVVDIVQAPTSGADSVQA